QRPIRAAEQRYSRKTAIMPVRRGSGTLRCHRSRGARGAQNFCQGRTMADSLTITDNRTGKQYELPIQYGVYPDYGAAISGIDLRQIKVDDNDFGLLSYDPAFMNTASCKSAITFIDGDKGILRYRGYEIEELATKSNFLEVAYLLLNGELPTKDQLDDWVQRITYSTLFHENIKKF